ncbi:MAG: hypothetical protein ACFFD4_29180 [Candidatus Odinarchaeota archaeon]
MSKQSTQPDTSPVNLLKIIIILLSSDSDSTTIQQQAGIKKHVLSQWIKRQSGLIAKKRHPNWQKKGDPELLYYLRLADYLSGTFDHLRTVDTGNQQYLFTPEREKQISDFFRDQRHTIAVAASKDFPKLAKLLEQDVTRDLFRHDPLSWLFISVCHHPVIDSNPFPRSFINNIVVDKVVRTIKPVLDLFIPDVQLASDVLGHARMNLLSLLVTSRENLDYFESGNILISDEGHYQDFRRVMFLYGADKEFHNQVLAFYEQAFDRYIKEKTRKRRETVQKDLGG